MMILLGQIRPSESPLQKQKRKQPRHIPRIRRNQSPDGGKGEEPIQDAGSGIRIHRRRFLACDRHRFPSLRRGQDFLVFKCGTADINCLSL